MYLLPFTKDVLFMIGSYGSQFLPKAVIYFCIKFLDFAIELKNTFTFLNPHLEKIVYNCLIPILQLTPNDQELWQMNPKEYTLRDKYESEIEEDPRTVAYVIL